MTDVTLPPPGLDGTHRETCIGCLTPTDTAVALTGEAEWIVAALMHVGLAEPEATAVLQAAADDALKLTGDDAMTGTNRVPDGRLGPIILRLCEACASRPDKPLNLGLVHGEIPHYQQR